MNTADAMNDLARVERAIEALVREHGAARVREHFAKLPITHWLNWQRVNGLIERYARKAGAR